MRLRLLGSTQSVVFFAPQEVNQSIMDVCKNHSQVTNSSHVVKWLLEQTCRTNENLQGLYISQGNDFVCRTEAQWKSNIKGANKDEYLKIIRHPERKSLEDLYGKRADISSATNSTDFVRFNEFADELNNRRQAVIANGRTAHSSALEEVEQEREVEQEVEEQRHVAKPNHRSALTFPGLHHTIRNFAMTGQLVGEEGYEHVFEALSRTEIGQKHDLCSTKSSLFASSELMRTVKTGPKGSNDGILVHKILSLQYSIANSL